jgi:hypothetical protein
MDCTLVLSCGVAYGVPAKNFPILPVGESVTLHLDGYVFEN